MSEAAQQAVGGRAHSGVWARVASERALATLAPAVIALHVADDTFLQPEPGVGATDHLAGGLVQLALVLIAGAAVASGRFRAGGRAALALLLGFFGVLAGTEAVYYAAAGGMSGDDYTGFFSLLGGFVLLGVGVVTLWRTRRTDGAASDCPSAARC